MEKTGANGGGRGLPWTDAVLIAAGSFLIAYSIKNVYEPATLVTGGVSGLAIIFHSLFSIPLWLTNTLANIPLFLIAFRIKGFRFIVRTLIATAALSAALYILPEKPLIAGGDVFLSALFGGVITGIGSGLVFRCRATTGGTDMLAAVLQHSFRHLSLPKILMVIDGMVVLLGAGIFGINTALYAVIAVFVMTKVSGFLIEGVKFAKVVYIISGSPDQIASDIMREMKRGVTAIFAEGMYTGAEKKILYCVLSQRELPQLKDIIYKTDPAAFVIVSDANEVMGEGFIESYDTD